MANMTNTTASPAGVRTNSPVETTHGKTTINDAVVAKVAGIAAREVTGVYGLGGGAARAMGAILSVVNSTDLTQGIRVEVGETQAAVDISIIAEYPVPLQTVASGVRTAVINAIETLVGMQVTEVNVTVNDVHLPSDDNNASTGEEARVL